MGSLDREPYIFDQLGIILDFIGAARKTLLFLTIDLFVVELETAIYTMLVEAICCLWYFLRRTVR